MPRPIEQQISEEGKKSNDLRVKALASSKPVPRQGETYSPRVVYKLMETLQAVLDAWKTGMKLRMSVPQEPMRDIPDDLYAGLLAVQKFVEMNMDEAENRPDHISFDVQDPSSLPDDTSLRMLASKLAFISSDRGLRKVATQPIKPEGMDEEEPSGSVDDNPGAILERNM